MESCIGLSTTCSHPRKIGVAKIVATIQDDRRQRVTGAGATNENPSENDLEMTETCDCNISHEDKSVDLMLTIWSYGKLAFQIDESSPSNDKNKFLKILQAASAGASIEQFHSAAQKISVILKIGDKSDLKYATHDDLVYTNLIPAMLRESNEQITTDEILSHFEEVKSKVYHLCYGQEIYFRGGSLRGPYQGNEFHARTSWRVPADGVYKIVAQGASNTITEKMAEKEPFSKNHAADWPRLVARGALVVGHFELFQGETIKVVVGKSGVSPADGCGGTFVYNNDKKEMLIVAGGAGGVRSYSDQHHANASLGWLGNPSDVKYDQMQQPGDAGQNLIFAGAGAGVENGPVCQTANYHRALPFLPSKMMTGGYTGTSSGVSGGGYGGGGYSLRTATNDYVGAGGGGGYSGGHAGENYGGGGGSYSKDINSVFRLQTGTMDGKQGYKSPVHAKCVIYPPGCHNSDGNDDFVITSTLESMETS